MKKAVEVFKKIYKLLEKRQKWIFVLIMLIMVVSAALTQFTPKSIGMLTDDILTANTVSFIKVLPFLAAILIVNVVNEIIKIVRRLLVEDTATRMEKRARTMVVKSLLKAPLKYFRENMTGNIHGKMNRSLEGTVKLEKLLFMDFVPAIFNSIAAVITIFTTLPFILALPMMLVIPIGVIIVFRQIFTQRGIRVELLESKSEMDGTVVELIGGIEVIRVCDSVGIETDRFEKKSEYLRAKEMKHHRQMAKYDCLKFINEAVFTVLIIGISTYLATMGVISVGSVLTAYLCFTQLIKPLEELHRIFDELSESMVLAEEFFKMVEIQNDFSYLTVRERNNFPRIIQGSNIISIRNLTFSYPETGNKKVLDCLNLDIKKGMFLGIAGPSGCGKSSLIKAISKLEKCDGDIFINSQSIDSMNRKEISDLIALVPQNPFIIAGTIYENICYGIEYEVPVNKVLEAAENAYLKGYIASLPDGLNSIIAEGGSNLSGGQKQRIAIARVFLRKPEILILDEATSALDNTSERYIQTKFEELQKENGTTIISIAHRLTTLKNCDKIIVLNNGKIEQSGKYDELKSIRGLFSDMYNGKVK